METLFLCVIIFLFMLAVFDLSVGVSNDAVNFLNSAIGSRAASFKRVLIIASIGVFIGAAMSNGMMDIARHGIFRPEHFSFYDLVCIFMAVMVTDIILLDIFNSLGMPTSTTVSMVFELLGASFAVALIKMAGGTDLGLADLLNTEKAFSVILGIFLSVAIAFVFGTLVQFISRTIFTFNYKSRMKWKIGIFGGICITAIVYFLLIKGTKDLVFMTPEVKAWISDNTFLLITACFAASTLLMQGLHALGANVLKIIVLTGTFSLAVAFAGNDLVNFIGVPLSGLAAYQDYAANGGGNPSGHLMGVLNGPSQTPVWFLVGAGVIMVAALATSKKAHAVTKTEIGLGSSREGEEMFGSSGIARRLVRLSLNVINFFDRITPPRVRRWFDKRFNTDEAIMDQGAAFDLIRGSVNLVLAGTLIALGTSMKLPLSTTFVTFMVAMGSSLADRAWSRESAVFRITGVISVIGGWFLTAGAAFIGAGIIVALMHLGGIWVMFALAALTVFIIIRSNRRFRNRRKEEKGDTLFQTILSSGGQEQTWGLLNLYMSGHQQKFMAYACETFRGITEAFVNEDPRALAKAQKSLDLYKNILKNDRRKETLCLRLVSRPEAIAKSAAFHLANSCCMGILYNLRRINETCKEHTDNNFTPLPENYWTGFMELRTRMTILFNNTADMISAQAPEVAGNLRRQCDELKAFVDGLSQKLYDGLREGDSGTMTVAYVYLNTLQETREVISTIRKYIRAYTLLQQ